jgi:hypothetical protein
MFVNLVLIDQEEEEEKDQEDEAVEAAAVAAIDETTKSLETHEEVKAPAGEEADHSPIQIISMTEGMVEEVVGGEVVIALSIDHKTLIGMRRLDTRIRMIRRDTSRRSREGSPSLSVEKMSGLIDTLHRLLLREGIH